MYVHDARTHAHIHTELSYSHKVIVLQHDNVTNFNAAPRHLLKTRNREQEYVKPLAAQWLAESKTAQVEEHDRH